MSERVGLRRSKKAADEANREAQPQGSTVERQPLQLVDQALQAEGQPLNEGALKSFESRFGHDFSRVRVHTDDRAAESAEALQAQAFTFGSDVVFGRGRFAPESEEGSRLLAHELTHVVQQEGTVGGPGEWAEVSSPTDSAEVEASQIENATSLEGGAQVSSRAPARIHRRPDYIVDMTFCGRGCGGGVNPVLKERLEAVQTQLRSTYEALPAEERFDVQGNLATTFGQWCGIAQAGGWRHGTMPTNKHWSGSAIDLNASSNPYIAIRTERNGQEVYGGEAAGAGLRTERVNATEVYDRAVKFMMGSDRSADVGARHGSGAQRESTGSVYDRIAEASTSLSLYLGFAFRNSMRQVNRRPVANAANASLEDLLRAIPETERFPQSDAMTSLEAYMEGDWFRGINLSWPLSPEEQYLQILRDYEMVRIPMVFGNPSARPASTRNPARGFLDLRRELVEAMADVGRLRWGASDLGEGESGDVMHFDLGNHGGYTPGD